MSGRRGTRTLNETSARQELRRRRLLDEGSTCEATRVSWTRLRKAPQARKSLSPRRKPWEDHRRRREPRQGRHIVIGRPRCKLCRPCRGSIVLSSQTHGLRRGLGLFRAFGALRKWGMSGSSIARGTDPRQRTLPITTCPAWRHAFRGRISTASDSERVAPQRDIAMFVVYSTSENA